MFLRQGQVHVNIIFIIIYIMLTAFMPPGFSPLGSLSTMSRRDSVSGSNIPLITELGIYVYAHFSSLLSYTLEF